MVHAYVFSWACNHVCRSNRIKFEFHEVKNMCFSNPLTLLKGWMQTFFILYCICLKANSDVGKRGCECTMNWCNDVSVNIELFE
jgi:hypothetical protein